LKLEKKIVAIVSGISDELNISKNENDYSIGKLKTSKLFNRIVIASPDDQSSDKINILANSWSVEYYAGAVNNVLDRFSSVIDKYQPDIICRVQLRACWVDTRLISQSIDLILKDFDYIEYGLDINYAMGADVFTANCFNKAKNIISQMDENIEKKTFEFSPWALMQNKTIFNVGIIEKTKLYPKYEIKRIKEKLNKLIGSEQNQLAVNPSDVGSRYRNVKNYVDKNDIVLDIACGKGGGTSYLSNHCKKIYGIDPDSRYIEYANKYYANSYTEFKKGTDLTLTELNIYFDKIVSLHTLEHVDNDKIFLTNLYKFMRPDGLLILEVPRLFKYPLGEPLWPFHKIEYSYNQLKNLVMETGFVIIEEKGGNRHCYVEIEQAREVLFFVAKK